MKKQKTHRPPNIIVFFTDQQRWDTTGVHGNPLELTTNFDRMAIQGTHIYHSFTCQPVCGPARSCMQTGMHATTTGCYKNRNPLPKDAKTLADYFKQAGYRTGYIGKWHLAEGTGPVVQSQRGGYEYWLASNLLELDSDSYHTVLFDNHCEQVNLPGYRVDALTDASIRYIDQHKDEPFFLFTSYLEPHQQNHLDDYPAPEGYRERYTGRWSPPDLQTLQGSSGQHLGGYFGMVKRLDEALGRILDALKSLRLDENTIVLFTSDHGCHFKTRNGENKRSCHESSIRVPTAFRGPGFDQGGQLRELVSLIDLPPTLLDAAGIPVPDHMQGKSILPLLRGECDDWQDDVFVQISEFSVSRAVRTRRWKYGVTAPDKDGYEHSGSSQYVEEFLYDLQADPYELNNLAGLTSYQEVAKIMSERLIAKMVEAGEEAPEITPAPERIPREMEQPYWWRSATSEEARQ